MDGRAEAWRRGKVRAPRGSAEIFGSRSRRERGTCGLRRSEEDGCDGTRVRPDDVLRGRGRLGLRGLRERDGRGGRGSRHGW